MFHTHNLFGSFCMCFYNKIKKGFYCCVVCSYSTDTNVIYLVIPFSLALSTACQSSYLQKRKKHQPPHCAECDCIVMPEDQETVCSLFSSIIFLVHCVQSYGYCLSLSMHGEFSSLNIS
ncbi:unnamed protein product [Natator depressus]